MAKCRYFDCVQPYLDTIRKKVREGVTEVEIAKSLGISKATLENYKNQFPELREALSKNKGSDVLEKLINAGIESACGCYKENEQTFYKMDENGEPVIEKVIVFKQWQPANQSLNKFYVQNFGKEQGFSNNPLEFDLQKKKQEFMEKLERQKNWDKDI
jgi:predicted transcriptional regulator